MKTSKPKIAVLSLISQETGEVRSKVIPDVTTKTLAAEVRAQVDTAASKLYTDQWVGYRKVGKDFIDHQAVEHARFECVRYTTTGVITTNQVEGFFSQLKQSLDGTHHHLSRKHLGSYLGEFDFRYTTPDLSDTAQLRMVMGQVGGIRLTYKPPTAA